MTQQLPYPGSIWRHRATQLLFRVVLVSETDIIAHNCEVAMRDNTPLISWRISPAGFAFAFDPAPDADYPKTAA